MDLEALLSARDEEHPSGENLEYDPAFVEMNTASRGKEERQVGDELEAAEDPDFVDVAEKALAIMERSHDLRAGVLWTVASLRTRGLVGFAEGMQYIRGCLEQRWETCFPQLDEEDGDPTFRINTIQTLGQDDSALRGLRLAPLTDSRTFGAMCFRDVQIAQGVITAPEEMEDIPDSGAIVAAFEDTDDSYVTETLSAARTAQSEVEQIDHIFMEHTPGFGPDFEKLSKEISKITEYLESVAGESGETAGGAGAGVADGSTEAGGQAGPSGAIRTPQDVSNALDRIIVYYQRNEPSSPVPLLLERAKRLVGADFVSIMKDMAPAGMENVSRVGGLPDDEEY